MALGDPPRLAELRTLYRQAIEWDDEHATPASRRARETAMDNLAAAYLGLGGGIITVALGVPGDRQQWQRVPLPGLIDT